MDLVTSMRRWLPLGGALLLCSCAQATTAGRVRELTHQMAELQEKYQQALDRQEELENRVLLLSDQLESQRVAHGRRGTVELPVVTLQPETAPGLGQQAPVEFAGAARSEEPERIRPLLRAEGESFAAQLQPSPEPAVRAEGRRAPGPVVRRPTPPPIAFGLGSRTRAPAGWAGARAPLPHIPPSGDNLGVVPVPRVAAVRAGAPAAEPRRPAAPQPAVAAGGDEAMNLYRAAYEHLRSGRYGEAERDLKEFVRRFPRHDYADNAQYWLGETYYARKTYGDAAGAFRAVVERWPTGNKAPDALLKLGFSLLMMGDAQKGRSVLTQVTQHYPNTEAARLADRRLAELKDSR